MAVVVVGGLKTTDSVVEVVSVVEPICPQTVPLQPIISTIIITTVSQIALTEKSVLLSLIVIIDYSLRHYKNSAVIENLFFIPTRRKKSANRLKKYLFFLLSRIIFVNQLFMPPDSEITILLNRINDGDGKAPEQLLPVVYQELRKLAHGYLQNERPDHTLQATALVHEAYIRMVDWENVSWQNRAHFFAVAANIMRKILVDHARQKRAQKRDFRQKLALDEAISFSSENELDLINLDEALNNLGKFDLLQSRLVELRFFGGLTIEETAHVLNISESTVKREWRFAKTWLQRELTK